MRREPTAARRQSATPQPETPVWALSTTYWRGRVLHDISWHDFVRLPGVTNKMAMEVDAAAEEGWPGVTPKTRRFLFKHGIDRVRPYDPA